MSGSFVETMRMIKIEHSIFALPYALASAFWAANGVPGWDVLVLILVAMVSARSAAMAFNRWLDADIDAKNPRTAIRSIPAGRLSKGYALGFTIISSLVFLFSAWALNPLAFMLSPGMLFVLLGYSYTKRFTPLCHLWLGLALGLSPLGAWVAVTGAFSWVPVWLGLAVLVWTTGFDIIYACQDIEFDRQHKLHSIPSYLGVTKSLWVTRILHLVMIAIIIGLGIHLQLGIAYYVGVGLVIALLTYEHHLVWDGSLEKVDMAFFTMNGMVSILFGIACIVDVFLD